MNADERIDVQKASDYKEAIPFDRKHLAHLNKLFMDELERRAQEYERDWKPTLLRRTK